MHDARARLALQERLGQQADQVVALDELPVLVEEEAAIVVAVPGQPDVGAGAAHDVGRGRLVLLAASDWARRSGKCRPARGSP